MHTTTIHRRTIAAATVLAAAWVAVPVPGAVAAPKPEPQPVIVSGCPIDVHDFAARLRAVGFTAQAANIATQLTDRDCRAAGFQVSIVHRPAGTHVLLPASMLVRRADAVAVIGQALLATCP